MNPALINEGVTPSVQFYHRKKKENTEISMASPSKIFFRLLAAVIQFARYRLIRERRSLHNR